MKISSFNFCNSPKSGRYIQVKLTNGTAWIIEQSRDGGEGYPLRLAGLSDREAKPAERSILQTAADALGRYLNGEPEGSGMSYGEMAAIDELAEVVSWGGNKPTKEDGGPGCVLAGFVANYENFC